MRLTTTRQARRIGFTLIELLVVIAIIGILVSLTAAAVMQFFSKGPELENVNNIQQLSVALGSFKTKFQTYPPSRIFLANNITAYTGAPPPGVAPQLQKESLTYLQQLWPRIDLTPATSKVNWGSAQGILEGDQCLVFFLGGMQSGGCLGFSTNPSNPTALPAAAGELRIGPFFDFKTTQLIAPSSRKAPLNGTALVYLDVYGAMPYAYFSSGKRANGYNATALVTGLLPTGDCPDLKVQPYAKNTLQYYSANDFQIISAGKDKIFGPGGLVPPGSPVPGVGADDFSNLTSGRHASGLQ